MSMMSGMIGTDALSNDSGADSFFNKKAEGESNPVASESQKKRVQRPASTGPQGLPRAPPSNLSSTAKGILAISGGEPPDVIRESPVEESFEH